MTLASLGPVAGGLALVLAAALFAAWLLRRLGLAQPAPSTSRIALVDSLQITPGRRIMLILCDGRHVLLATGGTTDVVLDAWTAAPDVSP